MTGAKKRKQVFHADGAALEVASMMTAEELEQTSLDSIVRSLNNAEDENEEDEEEYTAA